MGAVGERVQPTSPIAAQPAVDGLAADAIAVGDLDHREPVAQDFHDGIEALFCHCELQEHAPDLLTSPLVGEAQEAQAVVSTINRNSGTHQPVSTRQASTGSAHHSCHTIRAWLRAHPCVVVLPRTPAPPSRQALDHMRLGHLRCTAIVPFLGVGVTVGGAGGRQVMRGLLHAQRLRVGCMVELAMAGRRRGYGLDEGPDRESAPAGTEGGSARSIPADYRSGRAVRSRAWTSSLVPCLHLLGRSGDLAARARSCRSRGRWSIAEEQRAG